MYDNNIENIVKAQNGESKAMQDLLEANSGLIWSIVKRFKDRGHEMEDLYQIACVGFIKSIKRFNTNYDVKLSTFAVPYILGELKRYIRDDGPIKVSRSVKELLTKIKNAQNDFSKKNGREITINEISEILNVPVEDIAFALTSAKPLESIDEAVYDDDSKTKLIDQISTNKDEANTIVNNLTLKGLLNSLEPREKQLIMLRYYKEQTQTQVAKILGITQVQVSRLEKKILNSMREQMIG